MQPLEAVGSFFASLCIRKEYKESEGTDMYEK